MTDSKKDSSVSSKSPKMKEIGSKREEMKLEGDGLLLSKDQDKSELFSLLVV